MMACPHLIFVLMTLFLIKSQSFAQVQVFTTAGTYTVPKNARTIQVLVVGGGGGGGGLVGSYWEGGGGGGGGVIDTTIDVDYGDSFGVVIGLGGTPSIAHYNGWGEVPVSFSTNGGDSMLGNLVAYGGGAGSWELNAVAYSANNGGCGGGGTFTAGGSGVSGQGFDGGNGISDCSSTFYHCAIGGGGGGGAGGPGAQAGPNGAAAGGAGYSSAISGSLQTYAGGGGGIWRGDAGTNTPVVSPGGSGGGGNGYKCGGFYCYVGYDPSATYYGGGGGAGSFYGNGGFADPRGGYGYQGIVIVSVTSTKQLYPTVLTASIVRSMASDYDLTGCILPTAAVVKTFLSIQLRVENVGQQDFNIGSSELYAVNCGQGIAFPRMYAVTFNGGEYFNADKCVIDSSSASLLPAKFTSCSSMGISAGNYHTTTLWVEVPQDALSKGSAYNLTVTALPDKPALGSTSKPFQIRY